MDEKAPFLYRFMKDFDAPYGASDLNEDFRPEPLEPDPERPWPNNSNYLICFN
jgi:hypothetical protein